MKKIVAVIGSPNDEKSNTATLARDFAALVKDYDADVEFELISLGKKDISPCHGCLACTKTGKCVVKDDLAEVQKKIIESDLLIFGSPVYVQHVSAQTKCFLDRSFLWFHLFTLLGKPTITAITTAKDGVRPTKKYLSHMLSVMGGIVIGHIEGKAYGPGVFPTREECKQKNRALAKKVVDILNGKSKVRPKLYNKMAFRIMRHFKIKPGIKRNNYESKYWQDKGWMNLSFGRALKLEQSRKDSQAI